jgi:hypothetical protein
MSRQLDCFAERARTFLLKLVFVSAVAFVPAGSDAADSHSATTWVPPQFTVSGPVVIEVVYPAIELDSRYVDEGSFAEHGYNFWGNDLVSSTPFQTVFDTPTSYPYRFSEGGDTRLAEEPRAIDTIDTNSVALGDHPSIPEGMQYEFQGSGLQTLLLRERFVQFRLRQWPDVLLLKFPSFVVLQINRTEPPIESMEDYHFLMRHLHEVIHDFPRQGKIQSVLGIAREGDNTWNNAPISFLCRHSRFGM